LATRTGFKNTVKKANPHIRPILNIVVEKNMGLKKGKRRRGTKIIIQESHKKGKERG